MQTLRQLFYLSRAAPTLSAAAIQNILRASQRNNRRKDITGCLLYSGQHFAQVLEGDARQLSALVERIAKDPRNHGLVVVAEREVVVRDFGDWSMGFLCKLDVADRIEAMLALEQVSDQLALALLNEVKVDAVLGPL